MPNSPNISPLDRWKWSARVDVDRVADRALLMCLAESADRRTLRTTRALRGLQKQLRTGPRRLLEALERLEARGLVSIERRGRNRATRYTLNVHMATPELASTRKATAVTQGLPCFHRGSMLLPLWCLNLVSLLVFPPGINQERERTRTAGRRPPTPWGLRLPPYSRTRGANPGTDRRHGTTARFGG